MVHLPAEILDLILRELLYSMKLAPLTTINRQWQRAIEEILWRHLFIHPEDINSFINFFHSHPARPQMLKQLVFHADYFGVPVEYDSEDADSDYAEDSDEGDTSSEEYGGSEEEDEYELHDDELHNLKEDTIAYVDQRSYIDNIPNEDGKGGSFDSDEDSGDEAINESDDDEDDGQQSAGVDLNNKKHTKDEDAPPEANFEIFRNEHLRFFGDLKKMWDEMASWNDDLKVTDIRILMNGSSIYELLGKSFKDSKMVQSYLPAGEWLCSPDVPQLLPLASVKTFIFEPIVNTNVSLWSAIAACKIASTLPTLETLEMRGEDRDRRWRHARKELREVLAEQLKSLPPSLQSLFLSLEHSAIWNHEVDPQSFLVSSADHLSRALGCLPNRLTKLFLDVNQISSELFWNPDITFVPGTVIWPHLRVLDIRTGFETATGTYWMRAKDGYTGDASSVHYYWDTDRLSDADEQREAEELGNFNVRCFRVRPEPTLFDELSISIARAVACMPKLDYVNMEFHCHHRGPRSGGWFEHFKSYKGWAFYFRSGNDAKFASTHFDEYDDPGPDWTDIENPRTEWVFQCPYAQVQWEEPEEAKALWRGKFPLVEFHLVTLKEEDQSVDVVDAGYDTWERYRNDELICSSRRSYKPTTLAQSLTRARIEGLLSVGTTHEEMYTPR